MDEQVGQRERRSHAVLAAPAPAAEDSAAPGAGEPVPLRHWLALLALALAAMMDGVNAMIVTLASPVISAELSTGLSELQWVTTGYLLAYAGTLLLAGRLGDRYGHRRVFVVGMVGFMVSSVVVGLATGIWMLVVARVAQGAFGAALLPSALAILRLTFPSDKLKVAVGVFMGTLALSAAADPFLGGVIIEYAGWRWAFFINVIVGLVALVMTTALVRPTAPQDADRALDAVGIGLASGALAALVLGSTRSPSTAGPASSRCSASRPPSCSARCS